jgi:hypothetical protein
MEKVVNYGEHGDKFYIIILGVVSVQIPNMSIKNWVHHRKEYQYLKSWKKNEYDVKVERARQEHNKLYHNIDTEEKKGPLFDPKIHMI